MLPIDLAQYRPPANLLQDRVILITGAGDGIGRTAAITYAKYGARTILCGRTVSKLEQVHDDIVSTGCAQPGIYPMDLTGAADQDYLRMADILDREYGCLDGLLHNASILGNRLPLQYYPAEVWQRVIQTNLNAPFLMTHALLPLIQRSKDASIIFTSSGVGQVPRAFWGAYSVSKHGIEAMSAIFAQELEKTSVIRVNTINPGATRTHMRAEAYPAEDPGKLKTPAEIMTLYLYLMGPDSIGVNGQSLNAQDYTRDQAPGRQ
jgi:NAD(P)-dependent dehydrogenase (short-subunit alcohol dehydrogenase family)